MKHKHVFLLVVGVVILLTVGLSALVWNGVILLNGSAAKGYSVRGVDVSHYQGYIDWKILSEQDIHFAFIKATEGSSFVDDKFEYNFTEAQKTALKVGAYHFFSFDSGAETQAANFISTVKPFEGMLPPVIDFEFYGDIESNPPERAVVCQSLQTMLDILEAYYGLKPIIYATEATYELYLADGFDDYDLWIRNVISRPKLSDKREWTFWQYTNRGKLKGYNGEERFIDINVFSKDINAFNNYPVYSAK